VARPDAGTRVLRFFVVGVGAVLLMFALSYLLVSAGLAPFSGSVIAYALVFLVAYSAQRSWTFGGEHAHSSALPRYFVLQAGCAAVSGTVAHVAVTGFGLSPAAMSMLTAFAAGAASYVVSSVWVFPQQP